MEMKDHITEQFYKGSEEVLELASLGAEEMLLRLTDALGAGVADAGRTASLLISLVLISALFRAVFEGLDEKYSKMADLISVGIAALASVGVLKDAFFAVNAALTSMHTLMAAMMASVMTLNAASGRGISDAATVLMYSEIVQFINSSLLLPLTGVFGVSALTVPFGRFEGLSSVAGFVKRTAIFALSLVSALFSALIATGGMVSRSAESLAVKGVRFAAASFIPVIGASFAESLTAYTSAVATVKRMCGAGGMISLLLIVIPPLAVLLVSKMMIGLAALSSELLMADGARRLFSEIQGGLSVLLAVMLSSAGVFTVGLAVFALI